MAHVQTPSGQLHTCTEMSLNYSLQRCGDVCGFVAIVFTARVSWMSLPFRSRSNQSPSWPGYLLPAAYTLQPLLKEDAHCLVCVRGSGCGFCFSKHQCIHNRQTQVQAHSRYSETQTLMTAETQAQAHNVNRGTQALRTAETKAQANNTNRKIKVLKTGKTQIQARNTKSKTQALVTAETQV